MRREIDESRNNIYKKLQKTNKKTRIRNITTHMIEKELNKNFVILKHNILREIKIELNEDCNINHIDIGIKIAKISPIV